MCIFYKSPKFSKILFSLVMLFACSLSFGLGEKKEREIQNLIETGTEKELKAAFKKYNYLNNSTIGPEKDTLLLHAIKSHRDVNFLKLLIKGDVKLKKRNKNGQDALFYTSRYSDDNEKSLSYILSKWGSKRRISKDMLRKDKEGKCAYEYGLENLSEKNLEKIEKCLDPLKSIPVKRNYLEEKGLLTEELKKELSEQEEESRKNPKKLSGKAEDENSVKPESSETEKSGESKKKENSEAEKESEKNIENNSKNQEQKENSQEKQTASGQADNNSDNSEGNSSQNEKSLENSESQETTEEKKASQITLPKKTSVDIEKKQKEIESLSGKNSNVNESGKTFLFDYEPEFEDETPQDISSKTIELAKIKNPNTRDFNGRTPLMRAVRDGNDWEIRSLIASGADVNLLDNEGWSALMFAVRYQNNVEIVKLLLENGADIYASNRYGSTPLLLASCYTGNPEILKTVLNSYGGSENEIFRSFILAITSNSGNYASQIAKLQVFMDRGISMNRFYEGKTPLMYACEYASSTRVIKLLLDNGALYTIRDSSGKKAFDYAKQNNKLERDEIYWLLNGN